MANWNPYYGAPNYGPPMYSPSETPQEYYESDAMRSYNYPMPYQYNVDYYQNNEIPPNYNFSNAYTVQQVETQMNFNSNANNFVTNPISNPQSHHIYYENRAEKLIGSNPTFKTPHINELSYIQHSPNVFRNTGNQQSVDINNTELTDYNFSNFNPQLPKFENNTMPKSNTENIESSLTVTATEFHPNAKNGNDKQDQNDKNNFKSKGAIKKNALDEQNAENKHKNRKQYYNQSKSYTNRRYATSDNSKGFKNENVKLDERSYNSYDSHSKSSEKFIENDEKSKYSSYNRYGKSNQYSSRNFSNSRYGNKYDKKDFKTEEKKLEDVQSTSKQHISTEVVQTKEKNNDKNVTENRNSESNYDMNRRFGGYRNNKYGDNNSYSKNSYGKVKNEKKYNDSYTRVSRNGDESKNKFVNSEKESRRINENWRNRQPHENSNTSNQQYRNNFNYRNDKSHYNNKKSNKEEAETEKSKSKNVPSTEIKNEKLSQRERLTAQLINGKLECLVCCEKIRQNDSIWSCSNCYHILHLNCIKKWVTSSQAEKGWRCPACQKVNMDVPMDYYCYCGRTRDPATRAGDLPHSCGDTCGRLPRKMSCDHKCMLQCHPGPCPSCTVIVNRFCGCGSVQKSVICNQELFVCESDCKKKLNCGIHFCKQKCHIGDCDECTEKINLVCHCGKSNKTINCDAENSSKKDYACEAVCDKFLTCGKHKCTEICHPGDCEDCQLVPELIITCPCGKTKLTTERNSCADPIPCCDKICGKRLLCGRPVDPHRCDSVCHKDTCPPCGQTTLVRCRCGHMDRELPCTKLTGRPDDARCEKKCNKMRSCGRHKCNQKCCIEVDHECPLLCNRMLSCGQHRCEQTCHVGHCQPCYRSSFEELYCECGTSVLYPPVPCGTRRPSCNQPCTRRHACDHEVLHNCHSEARCPPCTILTHKWCYGKHELRKTIPCHQSEFSCGRPCGKGLSCGRHKCITPCHSGVCLTEGNNCTQPCTTPRMACGHPCAAQCHEGSCPDTPCKEMVRVTCECGHRSSSRACIDNIKEYQRIATAMLASKMNDMQLGHSVDIGDIVTGAGVRKPNTLKTLECNDECRIIERNRRLAIGLQIRNPDLSAKLTPKYSDFMRQWGKKDPRFCQTVHDKLTELVQLAKQSKQKSRSYSFESMNRDKRHFIHEYCEHFGCESAAYDQEPNRNVVATAVKDKAWLPSYSLLEVLNREAGQRKVPGPVLRSSANVITKSTSVSLPLNSRKEQAPIVKPPSPEGEYIDYFND